MLKNRIVLLSVFSILLFAGKEEAQSAGVAGINFDEPTFTLAIDTVEKISLMFEVHFGKQNSIDLTNHPFFKRTIQAYLFESPTRLPEGMKLTDEGLLSWSPNATQFNEVRQKVFLLHFRARDLNDNYVVGQVRVYGTGEAVEEPTIAEEEIVQQATEQRLPLTGTLFIDYVKNNDSIKIILPSVSNWNYRKEGELFSFELKAMGGNGDFKFELIDPVFLMTSLDAEGNFEWAPDYDVADRVSKIHRIDMRVKVFDTAGSDAYKDFALYVEDVNRPPVVNELPTFYIQYNTANVYQLNRPGFIFDPDGDSITFKPVLQELPQGMTLNARGQIQWQPSTRQFNYLRTNPMYLSFTVEDYPVGEKTLGQVKIEASQADLPPIITIIPKKDVFHLKEDEELQLNFFVTDPNGDDDILSFGFVSENSSIRSEALVKKADSQYSFSWTPGFDFIGIPGDKVEFDISFYAIDRDGNRTERNIVVTVEDTENLLEKDHILYDQYRTVLERAWDLVTQLNEKEKELEKKYRISRKGKKNRSITTAALGALTGLSPVVFMENPQGQKITAGVGGTATATIGTLEASSVIGESPAEIMRDLTTVSQKRNDLLVNGNVFASKYALPIAKRESGFQTDLRSLTIHLSFSDASKLELDAGWENSKSATVRNIKRVFKDFNPDNRFETNY